MKISIITLLFAFLFTNTLLGKVHELTVSTIEDDPGKACNIGFGKYRRKAKDICKKSKQKLDFDTLKVEKCIQEKLGFKKYKATYNIEFECKH